MLFVYFAAALVTDGRLDDGPSWLGCSTAPGRSYGDLEIFGGSGRDTPTAEDCCLLCEEHEPCVQCAPRGVSY